MAWEWHDRRRDREGCFARKDYSARINVRCTDELRDEIARRAALCYMEISEYICACLDILWRWEKLPGGPDQLRKLQERAEAQRAADTANGLILDNIMAKFGGLKDDQGRGKAAEEEGAEGDGTEGQRRKGGDNSPG